MNIQNTPFSSIEQVTGKYLKNNGTATSTSAETSKFDEILKTKQMADGENLSIKFSKHASERLNDRKINLTTEQLLRLQNGTKQANEKGINESLVLVDDLAFIVNAKKSTVITAMDQRDTEENIYTNIDGAVIT